MNRLWKPALFFLFALLLALLINMPAARLFGIVGTPDNIRVFQPQGKLLSGRVAGLEVNRFLLRDIEYEADLSCLPGFSVCYRITNPYGSLLARYQPLSGNIELTRVKIEFPLQDLDRIPVRVLLQPTGKLLLNLDRVSIDRDKLVDLNGFLVWKDAGLAGEDIN
ncbi:MAG: hypothetical protein ACC663_07955, partial [Gammaproteobacteria bacterium]